MLNTYIKIESRLTCTVSRWTILFYSKPSPTNLPALSLVHVRGKIENNFKIFISRKVFDPYFSTTFQYIIPWFIESFSDVLCRYYQMGVHRRMFK